MQEHVVTRTGADRLYGVGTTLALCLVLIVLMRRIPPVLPPTKQA
jgi:hypothetical protein